ncbi:MAG TPA: hypothetical protein VFL69_01485 [Marmoricola sp.]|nr:hypothetical protein [Marmoricola sp.]
MGLVTLWLVDAVAVVLVAAGGIWVGLWARPRWWRARSGPGAPAPRPGRTTPSIEESVARSRRLGRLHHGPAEGRSRAKAEGIRRAYDGALAECCSALEIVHLLEVLPPGPELDAERTRVERRLELSGVDLNLTG